jgi:hypothetical protein
MTTLVDRGAVVLAPAALIDARSPRVGVPTQFAPAQIAVVRDRTRTIPPEVLASATDVLDRRARRVTPLRVTEADRSPEVQPAAACAN